MTSTPADANWPRIGSKGSSYDVVVDWNKRLAHELPFFEREFRDAGVASVLDAGCGTGRHDIAFARMGLRVVGADPSEEMLDAARANAAEAGADVTFVDAGFGELAGLGLGTFDAVISTGNALPHVDGRAGLDAALADFAAMLRPGGLLVLHLLNHERLVETRPRHLPVVVRDTEDGTLVTLRLLEYDPPQEPERIWIEFMTAVKDAAASAADRPDLGWSASAHRSAHAALPVPLLEQALSRAGFPDVTVYGDHSRKLYAPLSDESVIVTARRR
jgi:glycine/sarcosine N-methyltransferase